MKLELNHYRWPQNDSFTVSCCTDYITGHEISCNFPFPDVLQYERLQGKYGSGESSTLEISVLPALINIWTKNVWPKQFDPVWPEWCELGYSSHSCLRKRKPRPPTVQTVNRGNYSRSSPPSLNMTYKLANHNVSMGGRQLNDVHQ